ncbi:MAG TPA: class I SAM-dependent methyltransferase [Candidatus Wallbacteria bacterium]|nr:class I SAM-dependent methyltransferase [Candidatus Wallbacteria bacterium]
MIKYALIMHIDAAEFQKLKSEAEVLSIPCISPSTGNLLEMVARLGRSKNIVEIGTGNGYSTLHLLSGAALNGGRVTTFEKDVPRFRLALNNLNNYAEKGMLKIFNEDALSVLDEVPANIDLLFIDGMKRQYCDILKKIWNKLEKNAIICSDDIFFQGVLEPEKTLDRHKSIVKGLREYIAYLNELENEGKIKNFFFDYENGISVSQKLE